LSSAIAIKPLFKQLDDCMNADKFRLKRRVSMLAKSINGKASDENVAANKALHAQYEKLKSDIERSIEKCRWRKANLPAIEYPPLPVSDKKEDIKAAIANNQVVIVAGETGSGKTTQLPKICLELGRGVSV
jgi:ATP-dependent helicase HrpA